MGQYYKPVSLDKEECLVSHDYDNGLKLMEHSYIGNNFVNVVEQLIAEDGLWNGNHIAWGGDYGDKGYYKGNKKIKPKFSEKKTYKYLINEDKKMYVDLEKVPLTNYGSCRMRVHPLPLLTSNGNGQGGGDYIGTSMELVGTWCGDVVTVSNEHPSDKYNELVPNFVEER